MSLFSWLRNRLSSGPGKRAGAHTLLRRSPFRPTLEALEQRWLPSTLTVTSTADSGAGSLRANIAAAQSGDTINFASSLAGQTITLTSGELLINKNLTIQGPGAGQLPVTISAWDSSRVFEIDGATTNVALSNLDVTAGIGAANTAPSHSSLDGQGGAIWNAGTLTLSSCSLFSNTLTHNTLNAQGGAIYNTGTLALSSCSLSNNSNYSANAAVAQGGAIYNAGTLKVSGSTLDNNSVGISSWDVTAGGNGGAIYNTGTLTISNSTLDGNKAIQDGNPANQDGEGAGVFNATKASATITGSTLSDNIAGTFGGAMYNNGTMTASGDIVSGNIASKGGGIYNASKLTVDTSHFSGNYPDAISGHYIDKGGNTFS